MPFSYVSRNEARIDQPAKFYLDKLLIGTTPEIFSINNNSNNESDIMADGSPYTLAAKDKAQSFSIEFPVFLTYDPGLVFSECKDYDISTYSDFWWIQKNEKFEPVVLTIMYGGGTTFNQKMLIESWDYNQDAKYASDWKVKLSLTDYHPIVNVAVGQAPNNPLVEQGLREGRL